MSGTFDERSSGSESAGKRAAPTIEGTATEVSVAPEAGAAKTEQTDSPEPRTNESATGALEAAANGEDDPEAETSDADEAGDDSSEQRLAREDAAVRDEKPAPMGERQRRPFGTRLLALIAALLTHALAGLAGGLTILAAFAWGYLPLPAPREDSGFGEIKTRIAALESAPLPKDNAADVEGLRSQLTALQSEVAEVKVSATDPAEVNALAAQLAQMETDLKSMVDAAKDGTSVADAAVISRQVAEAERRLDSQLQGKIQSEIKSALASGAGVGADDNTVQVLKTEVSELNAKLKALTEATMDAGDGSKLKPEISALQRRLNEIESTLPSLVDAVDAENIRTKKANLAIAFSGLREAVNSGRPYATELATMSVLSSDTEDLEALVEHENTGIPTVPMLSASLVSLRDQALSTQTEAAPDLLGRLLGSAKSLVTVRRVGEETEGNSPAAILARAEAELNAGKLHEAVLEVQGLKGPQAKVLGPWMDDALARLDADTTLQQLQEALLVSLAGGSEASQNTRSPTADEETE